MTITATELKANLSKYLLLAEKEDIYISRNGKVVVESDSSFQDKEKLVEELFASVPSTMTLEEAESERRKKIGKSQPEERSSWCCELILEFQNNS